MWLFKIKMGLTDHYVNDDMQKSILVLMMIAMRGVFELLEVYFEMLDKNIDVIGGGGRGGCVLKDFIGGIGQHFTSFLLG